MKKLVLGITVIAGAACSIGALAQSGLDRSSLPIADPVFPKVTELDARNATAPPPFTIAPPDGAPNYMGCFYSSKNSRRNNYEA